MIIKAGIEEESSIEDANLRFKICGWIYALGLWNNKEARIRHKGIYKIGRSINPSLRMGFLEYNN